MRYTTALHAATLLIDTDGDRNRDDSMPIPHPAD
jgi:hypothetical protein